MICPRCGKEMDNIPDDEDNPFIARYHYTNGQEISFEMIEKDEYTSPV